MTKTHTEYISAVLGNLCVDDIPPAVVSQANDLVLDWLGNAAAGVRTAFGQAVSGIAGRYGGYGRSHLFASLSQVDPLTAALVNGSCAHSNEFDDSHGPSLFHPGSPIISAALAIAEEKGVSGSDFLAGVVAGYEFSLRLAACVNPSHYRMWHTTGTVGVLGAALAVGRAVNMEPRTIVSALGMAGMQSAGLWEVLPGAPSAKNLLPGRAAQGGVLSALLAIKGIEGPTSILEGPRGFFRAMVPDTPKVGELVRDMGKRWRILETTIKAYPICGHVMTPVEAAMMLRKNVKLEYIEKITVFTNSTAIRIAGQRAPENLYQAKFSIPYCVAVALLYGRITQHEFTTEVLSEPQVHSIMQKIELKVDEGFDRDFERHRPARIEATLSQGPKAVTLARSRRGGPENPLSDGEKREKFIQLGKLAWGEKIAEEIWRRRNLIFDLDDVGTWLEGLRNGLT
jgi:2-methylcitrate dehydratase PrpD